MTDGALRVDEFHLTWREKRSLAKKEVRLAKSALREAQRSGSNSLIAAKETALENARRNRNQYLPAHRSYVAA